MDSNLEWFSLSYYGSISFPIDFCGKFVDTTFIFIPTFNKFQVNLGLPCIYSI